MTNLALLGAGGRMGPRLTANLKKSDYVVSYVEIGERGYSALRCAGVAPALPADALVAADEAVRRGVPARRVPARPHGTSRRRRARCSRTAPSKRRACCSSTCALNSEAQGGASRFEGEVLGKFATARLTPSRDADTLPSK